MCCHREIVTKRLQRLKKRKLDESRRKSKFKSSKCTCSGCKGFRCIQKNRVIEPDFLASLAYNRRISKDNETSMEPGYNEPVGEIALTPGETWWNNLINQRSNMPPLYRGPSVKPTRSECSSTTSGFRSATPVVFSYAFELSRSVTPLSINTENSLSEDNNQVGFEGAKSYSKMLQYHDNNRSKIESRAMTRNVSNDGITSGISKKDGRSSTLVSTNKQIEKRRKFIRTASHGSDCFSTCAKCSRILSKET